MAGIYLHIPFCKSRCVYCGFFSTTMLGSKETYVDALCEELTNRRNYISEDVETIYFGGGTPSQLDVRHIERLLSHVYNIYNVKEGAELTLEGNPDDLTIEYLTSLRKAGINRLSMGVQSFDNRRLQFLHRRHTSEQAKETVRNAQQVGFDNISIDLMFGFPSQTLADWQKDVDEALKLGVQHISAYSLMYEEGTSLTRMLEKGEVEEISDELSLQMYEHLMDALTNAGYEHYEISNFAKAGRQSRHNSNYWRGIPYLGVGAGAHSYDGKARHFNPDSIEEYLKGAPLEAEELTEDMLYDEYVFTGLRTNKGIDIKELAKKFGEERTRYCLDNAKPHIDGGRLLLQHDTMRLTRQGLFISNDILSDLMYVE